jgi:hypothetical protein
MAMNNRVLHSGLMIDELSRDSQTALMRCIDAVY